MPKKALFIHRSVGENLVSDGGVYELIKERVDLEFSDFNQNTQKLRTVSASSKSTLQMPGNDTHPENFAELFNSKHKSELLDLAQTFDLVVIKSCYPNSDIKSNEELLQVKKYYQSVFSFFERHKRKLLLLTSPPLRPTSTTPGSASRARELATWLSSSDFGSNIGVLDLYDLLADEHNVLKKEFRRLIWLDDHPNRKASRSIAPVFVSRIKECVDVNDK